MARPPVRSRMGPIAKQSKRAGGRVAARIAVFCSGNGGNFEAILAAIRRGKLRAQVAVMVCDNPKAFAIQRANRYGVPVAVLSPKLFPSRQAHEELIIRILKSQKVDLIALAGYMRILTPHLLNAYKGRVLNIHPSLLPAFRGAHAVRDAFEARVQETGVSVHVVTLKLDSGPVLAQKKIKVIKSDTLKSLEAKVHRVEHGLYPAALQRFIGGKKW